MNTRDERPVYNKTEDDLSSVVSDAVQLERKYTYSDYCKWDDDKRWELIQGIPYLMASPSRVHQKVVLSLGRAIENYLHDKHCEVYIAPLDVRLNADTEDNTVVQPDVLIVCDKSKLDDKGIIGAPDFIAEILSPSSAKNDIERKYYEYKNAGVKEYWIIDPLNKHLVAHTLQDGNYERKLYSSDDTCVPVTILEDCNINLKEIFDSIE